MGANTTRVPAPTKEVIGADFGTDGSITTACAEAESDSKASAPGFTLFNGRLAPSADRVPA